MTRSPKPQKRLACQSRATFCGLRWGLLVQSKPILKGKPSALPAQRNASKSARLMRGGKILNLARLPFAFRMILALDFADERYPAWNNHVRSAGGHALGLLLNHPAKLAAP